MPVPDCPVGYNCDFQISQNDPRIMIALIAAAVVVSICVTIAFLWRNRG